MAFVPVVLRAPDGKAYRLQVDDEAPIEAVKTKLVGALGLDPSRKYRLALIDSLRVEADSRIELDEVQEEAIRGLVPIPD